MQPAEETYLDHAASAPLRPEARSAILRTLDLGPGNASSAHGAGRRLRRVLGDARDVVAAWVGARAAQVVFTSGTSESNRLAIRGLLGPVRDRGRPLVVTTAAHDGVRALAGALRDEGADVREVTAAATGHVGAADVARTVGDETAVVTLGLVQPVTGAVQPASAIAAAVPTARVHVDAAQAAARMPLALDRLRAATLAVSAHKIGGPQGIGAVIVADGVELHATDGTSSQERGRRAGTEAVALAAGFAAAVTAQQSAPGAGMRTDLLAPLRAFVAATDGAELVTRPPAATGIALVRFAGCPGDAVLAALDARGVRVSTGTACASGARTPAHVLVAGGRTPSDASECVRVSTGWTTTDDDVARLVDALRAVLPRVRAALAAGSARGEKKLSRSSRRTAGPSP